MIIERDIGISLRSANRSSQYWCIYLTAMPWSCKEHSRPKFMRETANSQFRLRLLPSAYCVTSLVAKTIPRPFDKGKSRLSYCPHAVRHRIISLNGEAAMAKKPKKLDELFHDTLKDIYFAEKKIVSTLPKMAKAAQSEELKAAFETRTIFLP